MNRPADARALLEGLFETAIAAAHPATCLIPHLPAPPPAAGRLILLAAGKAAGAMTEVAEAYYLDRHGLARDRLAGVAGARHGYGRPTRVVPMIEAGHPIPDAAGLESAARALALAASATADDLVVVLISGGASANWIAPAAGLALAEKQAVTRALLRSGAVIGEINTVRKHLSAIKGGRLARAAHPARIVTCAISDVPGDDPAVIGSGPTVPDPTTLADARAIVARYRLDLPAAVTRALTDPGNESPKAGDAARAGQRNRERERVFLVRPAAPRPADRHGQFAAGENDGAPAGGLELARQLSVVRRDRARLAFDAVAEEDAVVARRAHGAFRGAEGIGRPRDQPKVRSGERRIAGLGTFVGGIGQRTRDRRGKA